MAPDRILLLDLDGTVCRGDNQVHEYARQVGAQLTGDAARELATAVSAFLDSPDDAARTGNLADAQDGYQAVEAIARALGATVDQLHHAFHTIRARLYAGEICAEAPAGLIELLTDLPDNVRVVLATNAPANGLANLLDRLHVATFLDEVITEVGKPAGLGPVVERLLDQAGAASEPQRLLSVGDIWENDLRVPLARGCQTAYVDRFDRDQGPAHARAVTLEDLYDDIREWALE